MQTLLPMNDLFGRLGMVLGVLLVPAATSAQDREYEYESEIEIETETETETHEVEVDAEHDMNRGADDRDDDGDGHISFVERWGMVMGIGGGVYGYTGTAMRASSEIGGGWDARVVLGTRTRFGFEAAYVGTATALDARGLDDGATLLGNGAEGSVRLNILTGQWRPFVSAGLAWRHYSLVFTDANTSSFQDDDDVVETPLAAGLDYQTSRFILGLRAVVRPAFGDDLIGDAALHSVGGDIRVGYEL